MFVLFKKETMHDVHQIDLPGLETRSALVVKLDLAHGGSLPVIAAHFGLLRHLCARQVKKLIELMKDTSERPTILLGNLNEWRLGDRSLLNTFHSVFGPLPIAVPSFPAKMPIPAVDCMIAHCSGVDTAVEVHDTPLARLASDRLPIKAVVNLKCVE
jgi:endonuclease/exonuclease/phosphatase family metal-dependent hydrolase